VSNASDGSTRDRGPAFFGRVTAGVSHELNNIFATINELSGLLGDLAAAGQRGRPPDPQRLESISQRISLQVERGQRQTKRLNRFAHSVDKQDGHTDLNAVAQEVLALFERVARLRKVEVLSALADGPLATSAEPFDLYQIVWHALELGVDAVGEGGQLELQLHPSGAGAGLVVRGGGSVPTVAPRAKLVTALQELVVPFCGQVSLNPDVGATFCLTVLLPKSPTRGGPS